MFDSLNPDTKTVQSTSNQEPWSAQQPFLQRGFQRAEDAFSANAGEYYPGQTVSDTSAATTQGQQGILGAAGQNAQNLSYTANGGWLNAGNPHFQGMVNQIGQAIRPNIDSTFAASGRMGSGSHQNVYASALTDQAGKLAYQDYGRERGLMDAAQRDYSPYAAMLGVGQQQEGQQQRLYDDSLKRWNYDQNRDTDRLNNYMNVVGNRSYGGQTTTNQPYTSNSLLQGVGAGASLLSGLGNFATGFRGLFGP